MALSPEELKLKEQWESARKSLGEMWATVNQHSKFKSEFIQRAKASGMSTARADQEYERALEVLRKGLVPLMNNYLEADRQWEAFVAAKNSIAR